MDINNINNLIKLSNHAFLLVLDYNSNPTATIKAILSYIVSLKSKEVNVDLNNILNLINLNNYPDLIWINLKNEMLKKETILEIKEKFSYPSNYLVDLKFYVIENIENSSSSALNSILKFLEEPTPNTYAIFTTNCKELLLDTIISRCQLIRLDRDENNLKKILNDSHLTKNQIKMFENLFYDIDSLQQFLYSYNFELINNIINDLLFNFKDNIKIYKNWELFKTLDINDIGVVLRSIANYCDNPKIKQELLELINNIKFNINKNLIYFKLIDILERNESNGI